jgi:copper chaperone NosL
MQLAIEREATRAVSTDDYPAPGSAARMARWILNRAAMVRRAALLCSAALLAGAIFQPLWGLTLWSVQFPKGLRMIVYPSTIKGNISDINALNHYIGMAPIADDFFPELKVLPVVFCLAAIACVVAAMLRRRWLAFVPLFLLAGTAIYGFWSMRERLYHFGHDLDPQAAITMAPFTPPMFGEFRIAQFATYSYFGMGTTLAVLAGLLVVFAVGLDLVQGNKHAVR